MFLSVLQLDLISAARYNLLVLCLLPVAVVMFIYKSCQYIKTGSVKTGPAEKIGYLVAFVACIVFFILRNTGAVAFLIMP